MDSSARLSPVLARVWHGSIMRDGAAAHSFFSLHCYKEETFNIAVGLTHCPAVVWRAVACRLFTRSHGANAAASFEGWGRAEPYVNMVHFILCSFMSIFAKSSERRGCFISLRARSLSKRQSMGVLGRSLQSRVKGCRSLWIRKSSILSVGWKFLKHEQMCSSKVLKSDLFLFFINKIEPQD